MKGIELTTTVTFELSKKKRIVLSAGEKLIYHRKVFTYLSEDQKQAFSITRAYGLRLIGQNMAIELPSN